MTVKRKKKMERRRRLVLAGKAGTRGPESRVTVGVIRRVGKRYAAGLPVELALALEIEFIPLQTFYSAVKAGAKLHTHWLREKARFLLLACEEIMARGEMVDKRWLLTRRHPDVFATPEERGLPTESSSADKTREDMQRIINDARELARQRMDRAAAERLEMKKETPKRHDTTPTMRP